MGYRIEKDSMGEVSIPQDSHYGAQTGRAVQNFTVSDYRIPKEFLSALAILKTAAAKANQDLEVITPEISEAVQGAAGEIREGLWDDQFPIDVFQTGSGTSWNMNINEVIASLANEKLTGKRGGKSPVHPNDHVNQGQSSNCIIPSALNVSNRMAAVHLGDALSGLRETLKGKVREFAKVIKIGRTHLQDAVPMTLGQEFAAFSTQIKKSIRRLESAFPHLEELPLGGTAIGTGLNAAQGFSEKAVAYVAEITEIPFIPCENPFEGISARDPQLELFGALNSIAVTLMKIAQDLRLLSSGPRTGLGEIVLPSLQPGSSIMPGKVNPVIPEMVIQAAAHVMGKYQTATIACQNSPLQLNIMMPLLAHESLTAINILTNAVESLDERCIAGISANKEACREQVEWSLAMVTPLAVKIGYDKAAELAYKAYKEKIKIRDILVNEGILTPEEAEVILDPAKMI